MSEELTLAEGRAMLDANTRKEFGISLNEFLERLNAGEWSSDEHENHEVQRMVVLLPFAGASWDGESVVYHNGEALLASLTDEQARESSET